MLVKYGAECADDIWELNQDAINELKTNYGLKPMSAVKLWNRIQKKQVRL